MTMRSSLAAASSSPASRAVPALVPTVLLATDGTPAARAATTVVSALAARWDVCPHVVTVYPPPPTPYDPMVSNMAWQFNLEDELQREVDRQLAACTDDASQWSRETGIGSPATEIVRIADARKSDLIVLGLRSHTMLDRVFRDETALSVMRHANAPVLAVTPLMKRVPQRIAVGIDFSRASIAAARAALTLLGDGGSLLLVYVEPPIEPFAEMAEGYGVIYAQGVAAAFVRLRQELASRGNVAIETIVLHGSVAAELLAFSGRADVDLLAVGSQRHSIAHRAFVGGVTSALARAATRSLLVVPPGRHA